MWNVLGEHPAITEERNSVKKKLEILNHSSKVLQKDPELQGIINIDEREEVKKSVHKSHSGMEEIQQQPPSMLNKMPSDPFFGDFSSSG